MDIQAAIIFGSLFVLFSFTTILVLRHSINRINFYFGFATAGFAFASLLCALAFAEITFNIDIKLLGDIGVIIYLWSPLGIYLSAITIRYGVTAYRQPLSLILIGLLSLVTLVFIGTTIFPEPPNRQIWFGTIIISVIFLVTAYEYYRLLVEIPELKNQFLFLLSGLIIGFFGLLIALATSRFDPQVLPMEFEAIAGATINIGVLLASIAFTNIPNKIRGPEFGKGMSTS